MADFSDLGLFTVNRESQWEVALRLRRSPRTNLSDRVLVLGVRRHAYNGWKSWSVLKRAVLGELRDSIPEVTSGVCAVGACINGVRKPQLKDGKRWTRGGLPLTDVRKTRAIKTRFMRKGTGSGGARRGCARWGASMTALLLLWRVTCVILAGGGTARPLNTCKSPLSHRLGVGTSWGDETGRISQASSWPSWLKPTDKNGRVYCDYPKRDARERRRLPSAVGQAENTTGVRE